MSQDLVRTFLRALEDRDLPKAQAMLAPGAIMTFPGGNQFETLEALVDWSKNRYRNVRKTFQAFDELTRDGVTVIHVHGVLNGDGLDGQPIRDVRFIDRFEIRGGKIIDQKVWNDLAVGKSR